MSGLLTERSVKIASACIALAFFLFPTFSHATTLYTSSFGDTLDSFGIVHVYDPVTNPGVDIFANSQTADFVNNTTSGLRPFSGGSLLVVNTNAGTGYGADFYFGSYLVTNYPASIGVPLYVCIDRAGSYPTPCLNWAQITVFASTSLSVASSSPNIDWSQYWAPTLNATNSAAIATSGALWGSLEIASSTVNCTGGNIFSNGICSAFAYLFVPDPNILNDTVHLPQVAESRFPFNWVVELQTIFGGLASSTDQMTSFSYSWSAMSVATGTLSLHSIAPASTTIFSRGTIQTYLPNSIWNVFQTLIAAGIWLTFAADVFFTARNQMHRV